MLRVVRCHRGECKWTCVRNSSQTPLLSCPVCPEARGQSVFCFVSHDVLQKRVKLSYIPSQIAFNNLFFFFGMVSN